MLEIAFIRATGIFDDSRSTKEIISLSKAGYRIHVLSWDRYGNADEKNRKIFQEYPNIEFSYYEKLIPMGIGIKNIFKLLGWFAWIDMNLKKHQNLKVVHACNLDTVIPAMRYCRRKKCKLVYDVFDYYVDSHNIPSFLEKTVENKEIEAINYADVTIICTEERREQIAKANPKKVIVVYNSPDITKQYSDGVCYDYVYCGALCSKRLVGEILDEYPKHANLKFFFAGYGEYAKKCKELAGQYQNFTYSEPIPYEQVLEAEAKSRCLSAIYEPSIRNHRLCAPNKFYESLALAKPVIVCEGTGIDETVNKNKIGTVIEYDVEQFFNAVELLKHNEKLCTEMGVHGKKLYEEKFRWQIMSKRLLLLYERII